MDTKSPRSKLTIPVWDRLYNRLEKRTEETCIRRDALLERVLALEIEHLRDDLAESNSAAGRAHIEHHFKLLLLGAKKQLSLSLSPQTALKLESVCKEKNVPREVFLNRVILLLVAKPEFVDEALFGLGPREAHAIRMEIKDKLSLNLELENGFAPLSMIADLLTDPFWRYREMVEEVFKDVPEKHTLYGIPFGSDLARHRDPRLCGLDCYVKDSEVPGTEAYRTRAREGNQLLVDIFGDADSPPKSAEADETTRRKS